MNRKLLIISLLIFVLSFTSVFAGLRNDLVDRTPQEVLEKSYALADSVEFAKIVGCVSSPTGEFGSAVALDPYTILTCAHAEFLETVDRVGVTFASQPFLEGLDAKSHMIILNNKPIVHPFMKWNKNIKNIQILEKRNSYFCCGVPLECFEKMSFDQFIQLGVVKDSPFSGVDLAIIKLTKPLPNNVVYPEILSDDVAVKDTYAVSLGYGRHNTEPSVRAEFRGRIQPVFPTYIDIRPYKDWIKQHMGKPN